MPKHPPDGDGGETVGLRRAQVGIVFSCGIDLENWSRLMCFIFSCCWKESLGIRVPTAASLILEREYHSSMQSPLAREPQGVGVPGF